MLKEASSRKAPLRRRSGPSVDRTVAALRAIRGQGARTRPEVRIVAIRTGRQLA